MVNTHKIYFDLKDMIKRTLVIIHSTQHTLIENPTYGRRESFNTD
jgi:hypothetical protein